MTPTLEDAGRHLRGRLGHRYLYVSECTSTQDLLRGEDLPDGTVAVADHQTAGRGRSGRSWEAEPRTSLLCSVLLRPTGDVPAPQLSLVAAVATADAVEWATGLAAQVKWPNDVLLDGAKVAGILLEGEGDTILIGIGINVNQRPDELPSTTRLPATSLRAATGYEHGRGELLVTLLDRLEHGVDAWLQGDLESILAAFERRNALRGRRVKTRLGTGTAGSVADDGRLVVVLDSGGEVRVESGEIELL